MVDPAPVRDPGADTDFMVSVVIPAYNEAAVIEDTLRALIAALDPQPFRWEILVVNDASQDGTEAVLLALEASEPRLRHVNNVGRHGYGHAVRCGLAEFRGDAVIVAMADGSDAPADLVTYALKLREGYACAFGMRFGPDSDVQGYPAFKRVLNRLGNRLIAFCVGHDYTDFTNGFKGFRRHVVEDLMQPLVCGEFNLTIEMSLKAVLGGASYAVVPNSWVQRAAGESKFKVFSLSWLYLLTIVYCLIDARLKRGGARRPSG
jgi:dolichol-phosphate mannosyltransferase